MGRKLFKVNITSYYIKTERVEYFSLIYVCVSGSSHILLEFRLDIEVDRDHCLLPVLLAPVSALVVVTHKFALLPESSNTHHWHIVKLLHVLANFGLGEEVVAAETHYVVFVGFGRTRQCELVVNKFDLLRRFLETRGNGRLDALGVHIFFELEAVLVVLVQFSQGLSPRFHGSLELTELFGLEVAHLLWVSHIEIELLWVEPEPLHY